jgi:serine/threonine protein kinase/WD40 repeat protein
VNQTEHWQAGPRSPGSTPDDPRVLKAVEEYLAAQQAGRPIDRDAFLARHADLAPALAQCLDGLEMIQAAAPLLRDPSGRDGLDVSSGALIPEELLGDYRLVREIGRGGMGVVYEAIQMSLGRRVALKVLPFASALDARQLQRFKNEAQAAAQLHHTHIVPVYGVGCERGVHYYAMQLIDGQTLAALIHEWRQQEGLEVVVPATVIQPSPPDQPTTGFTPTALPDADTATQPAAQASTQPSIRGPAFFRTAAELAIQAAEALEHAHQMGVIHRDIKPANLLVDWRGSLWVTDFGLAHCRSQSGLTMTGDLVGTLRYMSPEQALAQRGAVDQRSDVYSLGVTLYELLTLVPAFDGQDRQELLRQIAFEEPRPPRRIHRAIPAELETIVLKAMAKEPAERYATAEELADDLQRFLKDEPIRARRPTVQQRTTKWARRHRGVAWMGVLLLAVLALGSAASTALIYRQLTRANQAEEELAAKLEVVEEAQKEATKNKEKAEGAERDKTEKLGQARLAQAQAGRSSGRAGRAFDSLKALSEAAQIAHTLKLPDDDILTLRNEAIACMALLDLQPRPELARGVPDKLLQRYATSDGQGTITIRRIAGDQEILRLGGDGARPYHLEFSPDGRFLAATYPHAPQAPRSLVLIWDLARRQIRCRLTPDVGAAVKPWVIWSPDSRRLAVADDWPFPTMAVYDIDSQKEIEHFHSREGYDWCDFDPSGRQLALLGNNNGAVEIRDLDTGKVVRHFNFPVAVRRIVWGCDGALLAATFYDEDERPLESHRIYLWDVPAGRMHKLLDGHQRAPTHLAFSHAGDLLASNSWDGTLRLWDPWTGKELLRTGWAGWGRLEFTSEDRFLLSRQATGGTEGCFAVNRGREYRQLHTTSGATGVVAFSPDGRLLASQGRSVYQVTGAPFGTHLWDVATGRHAALLPDKGGPFLFEPGGRSLLAPSPLGLYRWPLSLDEDEQGRRLRIGPPARLGRAVSGRWRSLATAAHSSRANPRTPMP